MIAYKKSDFTILEKIGEGAYGKVYKVSLKKDPSKQFALKIISKSKIETLKFAPQLQKEIKILSNCNHKNIIKLISVFHEQNSIHLLTELAKQGSLYDMLKKEKKFDEKTVLNYMLQIIQGIQYLQNQSPPVIHRDIKPENILLSNGIIKICDFGWSNYDDQTIRNTLCGTPDYNSPEVILGTGHGEKIDVWALGVLMYELLHGRPPFSPVYLIKDFRVLRNTIESNILKGKLVFDKSVSKGAKNAILTMLNPKKELRPLARDLLNIEFFKEKRVERKESLHLQKLKEQRQEFGEDFRKKFFMLEISYKKEIDKVSNLSKILNEKDLLLNKKREELNNLKNYYQENDKNNDVSSVIKEQISNLSKSLKEKDNLLNLKIQEIIILKNSIQNTNKNYKKILLENKTLVEFKNKPINSKNNKKEEIKSLNLKLTQKEETITYLFGLTKKITKMINDFYDINFDLKKEDINSGISFNNILNKLSSIFQLYNKDKRNFNFEKGRDFENVPILTNNNNFKTSSNLEKKIEKDLSSTINLADLRRSPEKSRGRNNLKKQMNRSKSKTFSSNRFVNHYK